MPGRNRGNANPSDLDYLVLTSLIPEPLYGYAIVRRDIMGRTEGFDEAQPWPAGNGREGAHITVAKCSKRVRGVQY